MDRTGERYSHVVILDPDQGAVTDGPLHFNDGGPSVPISADDLHAYVRKNGSRVEWGITSKDTGALISGFAIDVATGSYVLFSLQGPDAHGRCNETANSV